MYNMQNSWWNFLSKNKKLTPSPIKNFKSSQIICLSPKSDLIYYDENIMEFDFSYKILVDRSSTICQVLWLVPFVAIVFLRFEYILHSSLFLTRKHCECQSHHIISVPIILENIGYIGLNILHIRSHDANTLGTFKIINLLSGFPLLYVVSFVLVSCKMQTRERIKSGSELLKKLAVMDEFCF